VLDQVGDGLQGFWAELEQGPQLGAGDAGVADQGQQFDLLAEQPGPAGLIIVEEERGRDAEGAGQRSLFSPGSEL
jgi:hypothetical protein